MKPIMVKVDPTTEEAYLDIRDFSDLVDISMIHSYELSDIKSGTLTLKFYDKDGKLIPLSPKKQ